MVLSVVKTLVIGRLEDVEEEARAQARMNERSVDVMQRNPTIKTVSPLTYAGKLPAATVSSLARIEYGVALG